jgi:putative nucleotidyltransferase with HDIG domain
MMTTYALTRDEVVERMGTLPCFPRVVIDILATLDDPEANLNVLAEHIRHDPVISARVLARANSAAARKQGMSAVRDVFTAISMIGMGIVREMALLGSIAQYVRAVVPPGGPTDGYWQHSVAVGVCSQELAFHATDRVSADAALIAGLLHDVGQLWLFRFKADLFGEIWNREIVHTTGIDAAERSQFGVDHATIGAWLIESWSLPRNLETAVRHHHHPDNALAEPLVPLVYVAEVLSNALDLSGRGKNRVTTLSGEACRRLGLTWSDDLHPLFGRIEARGRHALGLLT